jgi:hypothetical protein
MVYCVTETNLCPPGPEIWGCPTNKGKAAALPRCSSAICPTVVRRTSAVGHMVLAPMTKGLRGLAKRWNQSDGKGCGDCCVLSGGGCAMAGLGVPLAWQWRSIRNTEALKKAAPAPAADVEANQCWWGSEEVLPLNVLMEVGPRQGMKTEGCPGSYRQVSRSRLEVCPSVQRE